MEPSTCVTEDYRPRGVKEEVDAHGFAMQLVVQLHLGMLVGVARASGPGRQGALASQVGLASPGRTEMQGCCLYYRNRLVLPFWQCYSSPLAAGVIGWVEADFLEPTPNWEDFQRTPTFSKLEVRQLVQLALCGLPHRQAPALLSSITPARLPACLPARVPARPSACRTGLCLIDAGVVACRWVQAFLKRSFAAFCKRMVQQGAIAEPRQQLVTRQLVAVPTPRGLALRPANDPPDNISGAPPAAKPPASLPMAALTAAVAPAAAAAAPPGAPLLVPKAIPTVAPARFFARPGPLGPALPAHALPPCSTGTGTGTTSTDGNQQLLSALLALLAPSLPAPGLKPMDLAGLAQLQQLLQLQKVLHGQEQQEPQQQPQEQQQEHQQRLLLPAAQQQLLPSGQPQQPQQHIQTLLAAADLQTTRGHTDNQQLSHERRLPQQLRPPQLRPPRLERLPELQHSTMPAQGASSANSLGEAPATATNFVSTDSTCLEQQLAACLLQLTGRQLTDTRDGRQGGGWRCGPAAGSTEPGPGGRAAEDQGGSEMLADMQGAPARVEQQILEYVGSIASLGGDTEQRGRQLAQDVRDTLVR